VQIDSAYVHRGLNLHPGGGLIALGTSPLISTCRRFRRSGSGIGADEISAIVYGCLGLVMTVLVGPYSTNDPAYMTAIVSDMY